jgi:phospholipase/carboxylesterase
MELQPLKYIYKPSGNPSAYTLLLLHGTGGDENDLLPLANDFGSGFNILSLRGNVSENGMPRFFKRLGMGVFDEKDLDFRTDEMVLFIKGLATQEGFDPDKIIALGYSNGANIAGATLVKYPTFLAGAILYRPMQPFKQITVDEKANNVPVFFSSGRLDSMVTPQEIQRYLAELKNIGFDTEFHELPVGHNLTHQDISFSVDWFNKYFK